jgi:hypothetical protein
MGSGITAFGQKTISNVTPNIKYETLGTAWVLSQDNFNKQEKKGTLMYKHSPILDSSYRTVEPVIGIIYQYLKDTVDAVEYSISNMGQKPYTIKYELLGGYPDYSSDKHSAIFKGEYLRDGVKHIVMLGYIVANNIGIEIIGDATSQVYGKVESDIKQFIKSVHLE